MRNARCPATTTWTTWGSRVCRRWRRSRLTVAACSTGKARRSRSACPRRPTWSPTRRVADSKHPWCVSGAKRCPTREGRFCEELSWTNADCVITDEGTSCASQHLVRPVRPVAATRDNEREWKHHREDERRRGYCDVLCDVEDNMANVRRKRTSRKRGWNVTVAAEVCVDVTWNLSHVRYSDLSEIQSWIWEFFCWMRGCDSAEKLSWLYVEDWVSQLRPILSWWLAIRTENVSLK